MIPGLDTGGLAGLFAAVVLIGVPIGAVGIGGLLLPPVLIGLGGLPVREAMVTSLTSFMITGLVAIALLPGKVRFLGAWWPLILAALPGALAGAVALWVIPSDLALAILILFVFDSARRAWAVAPTGRRRPKAAGVPCLGFRTQILIGGSVGFLSALTGTGGPMALIPVLIWADVALPTAIALGQILQVPVSGMATLGNAMLGSVDPVAGATIGLALLPGMVAGHRLRNRMSLALLARATAVVLVLAGAFLGWGLLSRQGFLPG